MRIIGLDIHRAFAEAVAWEDGRLRRLGRVDMRRDLLDAFAAKLSFGAVLGPCQKTMLHGRPPWQGEKARCGTGMQITPFQPFVHLYAILSIIVLYPFP
nr:hypothetical protein [Mesorhizobium ciceri]